MKVLSPKEDEEKLKRWGERERKQKIERRATKIPQTYVYMI
jgi:hypothetical protein